MGLKRHKPEEIFTKLRQVEVLAGQGHQFKPKDSTKRGGYLGRRPQVVGSGVASSMSGSGKEGGCRRQ